MPRLRFTKVRHESYLTSPPWEVFCPSQRALKSSLPLLYAYGFMVWKSLPSQMGRMCALAPCKTIGTPSIIQGWLKMPIRYGNKVGAVVWRCFCRGWIWKDRVVSCVSVLHPVVPPLGWWVGLPYSHGRWARPWEGYILLLNVGGPCLKSIMAGTHHI